MPKASSRLASALVQPGGVGGREGEVQDDRPPLLLGTARNQPPRAAPALGRLGRPGIPQLYWPGLTVMSGEGSLQGTRQGAWPTLGQPQIGPGSELEPQGQVVRRRIGLASLTNPVELRWWECVEFQVSLPPLGSSPVWAFCEPLTWTPRPVEWERRQHFCGEGILLGHLTR